MSDEEDESMSEGFSASEEEWHPGKEGRGGESSDDDDSDFEEVPAGNRSGRSSVTNLMKKDSKLSGVLKQQSAVKKRKPTGQSLRAKLYNKYRPPPKSLPSGGSGKNSPSASTSKGKSKNSQTPNEDDNSNSDGSVDNYLVNPDDIDLRSSFYQNLRVSKNNDEDEGDVDVLPVFDCNAGIKNMSDSDSEDNNESSHGEHVRGTNFNFAELLDNANNLECIKLNISKKNSVNSKETTTTNAAIDVDTLLALGEPEMIDKRGKDNTVSKLCKTKSTRVKRHTKTRPVSTVDADDTDDSEFEEVAETSQNALLPAGGSSLEIQVEMEQRRRRDAKKQTKEDLEMVLRRKLNRNLKDRQLLLHKASLLCQFGRTHYYNRLLNDTQIMQKVLPLLPSQNAYPPKSGTEIKYFISLTTWYKTTIKLIDSSMYPQHPRKKLKRKYLKQHLMEQIGNKQACCKQDMIFIYVVLLRAMGLQCRLVCNFQPLPMKPSQSDLLSLKLKSDNDNQRSKEKVTNTSGISAVTKKEKTSSGVNLKKLEKVKVASGGVADYVKEKEDDFIKKPKEVNSAEPSKRTTTRRKQANKKEDEVKVADEGKEEEAEPSKRTTTRRKQVHTEENVGSRKVKRTTTTNSQEFQNAAGNSKSSRGKQAEETKCDNDKKAEVVARSSARSKTILKDNQSTNIPIIKEPEVGEKQQRTRLSIPSRSVSPKFQISPKFMQGESYKAKVSPDPKFAHIDAKKKSTTNPIKIKLDLGENTARVTRQRNKAAKIPQLDGADELLQPKTKSRSTRPQLKKLNKTRSKEESDEDFQVVPAKKPKAPMAEKKSPRAVLSSDEEPTQDTNSPKKKSKATDIWVEAWSDKEECWVCIEIFSVKVHSVEAIRKTASSSLAYVYAFQNDLSVKDVTARYCLNWGSVVRKSRVDANWLSTALSHTVVKKTKRDLAEDQELRRIHEEKPLPTTISEYKDHPLYALERHLLKFQAIYPPNAPTLGFVRKEPVYSRDCVHLLHSRELWHRMARVVKLGEKAYKVVKARPKWDRHTQTVIKDQPLDIFGFWQTKQYEPPVAENGIVPRNEYGNVELFKECMLPKNCVHLRLPGLQRICKKLGIDCANAVVGFDFHQGACHPEYDGFIVCEEFKDTVIEAWHDDQRIQEEKERDKYEARVFGNWKKLIKGLLIRERLKAKYNY